MKRQSWHWYKKESPSGRILLGTVHGDVHDLGKNIFGMLLTSHGFDVVDLGVDIEPEVFVEKAIEVQPDIIGLSGLITASFESMKETVNAINKETAKQGQKFPILIGGGFITEDVSNYVGADYWMTDAMAGVRLCEDLLKK
ncbi:MAG: cobalamin-dependent protein [Anaerolineales bacterium]